MSRRPRALRPEEQEIWDQVARSARAMHHRAAPPPAAALPDSKPLIEPAPLPMPVVPKMPTSGFRLGSRAKVKPLGHDLAPSIGETLREAPLQMDAGTHKAMRRGKVMPEARLDLHGLTLSEAHPELVRFILNAHADGMRLVLVITGKGKARDDGGPIPTRTGALRHQVPQWMRLPPLSPVILQVTQSHLRHGGEGAYYVYLRRTR